MTRICDCYVSPLWMDPDSCGFMQGHKESNVTHTTIRNAAEQGFADAQFNLGALGVPRTRRGSRYNRAARSGWCTVCVSGGTPRSLSNTQHAAVACPA